MTRRLQYELDRWLRSEATDDVRAEEAFDALMRAVPRMAPRSGFAERVLWAVQPAPAPRVTVPAWGWKAAAAVSMALAGVTIALIPLVRFLPVEIPRVNDVFTTWARAVSWVAGLVDAGLEFWSLLARVGGAIGLAMATPEAAMALAALVMVSSVALYTLNQLLTFERRIV